MLICGEKRSCSDKKRDGCSQSTSNSNGKKNSKCCMPKPLPPKEDCQYALGKTQKDKSDCCCCCTCEPDPPPKITKPSLHIPFCGGFLGVGLDRADMCEILGVCLPPMVFEPTFNDFLGLEDERYDAAIDSDCLDDECAARAFAEIEPCDLMQSVNDKIECQCEQQHDPCAAEDETKPVAASGCDAFMAELGGGTNDPSNDFNKYLNDL